MISIANIFDNFLRLPDKASTILDINVGRCAPLLAKQKDSLAARVKEDQTLRLSLPALTRRMLELPKTRGEITDKEIEDTTGATERCCQRCSRYARWRST